MRIYTKEALIATSGWATLVAAQPTINYDCDPCLERSDYSVHAIVHGTKTDPFWQQVKSAAEQAARDMNVKFKIDLYNSFDVDKMASDISKVAASSSGSSNKPNALIVSIPSDTVAAAVADVVEAGIPVLGLNAGASMGKMVGVLDFVAPDDVMGGKLAGEAMVNASSVTIEKALFVNDEKGNIVNDHRLLGFRQGLGADADIEEFVIDGTMSTADLEAALTTKFEGCSYQAVQLSGTRAVTAAAAAYSAAQCSISSQVLGAFDTTEAVLDAIGNDQLTFTIDNQQYLQGALTTVLASIVATTGKSLASAAEVEGGAYLTGPQIIEKKTLPSDTIKTCMDEAFPVCPNTEAPDGTDAQCSCSDRKKIKIGGVTHGITTDTFWDPVYAASRQAAIDMGVELFNDRWEPEDDESILHTKMANRISHLCTSEDVDGIFVSIPSNLVLDAIQECLDLGKPVMSVNAGAKMSQSMGLMHHIGMLEFNAGFGAGEYLTQTTDMTRAICINHAEGVNVVEERCAGFADAVQAAGVEYLGQVYVRSDNTPNYIQSVEDHVNEEGDWDGMGILAAGGPQHVPVIALQARHQGTIIGAFDTSLELYAAVDSGIKEFGIDQQPYMQGYMPVVLLAYAVATGQTVSNQVVESGPAFIAASPSDAQQTCEDNLFLTCESEETPVEEKDRGLVIGLSIVAGVLACAIMFVVWRLSSLNDHVARLEAEGKEVKTLSMSQRLASAIKSPEQIAQDAVIS